MNKKKISIFVSKIQGGGAERSAVNVANYIAKKGYDVDLISLKRKQNTKILNNKINFISLDTSRLIFSLPKLFRYISDKNNSNFYFVPFLNGNNVISIFLKIIFRKFNLICTIHNPVYSHYKYTTFKDKIVIKILVLFKNIPNKFITCSHYIKNELIRKYSFNSKNIKHVYNPLDFSEIKKKSKIENKFLAKYKKKNKILLSIGRLTYQKNFESLILKIKPILIKKNIILVILGSGKNYKKLKNLIKLNNLNRKVFLLGYKPNPFNYLKNSDLFILNSRWEGLGSVIIESIFLKIPIICNKCPGGINEIFDYKNNYSIFDFKNQKQLEKTVIDLLYKNKTKIPMLNSKFLKKFDVNKASHEYLDFIIN